jgi:hypothetical protein
VKIALVDVDGHNFPNFALMRISAWHKLQGDDVEWYSPLFSNPDRIYASKVFTFTPDYLDYNPTHPEPIKGGTGYRMYNELPEEIDRMLPDYSIYPEYDYAIGFLSRGCIRNCPWCVVPRKEGALRQYDDIERIAQGRKHIVLMDNNFLANDFEFVKEQLEKSVRLGLKIDFNQGLDARLITPKNAALLAKVKWSSASGNNRYIRFSCDTAGMIEPLRNAVKTLRQAGYKGEIFIYVLAQELEESLERIKKILEIDNKINPFVQPYRNLDGDGQIVDLQLKRLARWCNMASIRKSCNFENYKG